MVRQGQPPAFGLGAGAALADAALDDLVAEHDGTLHVWQLDPLLRPVGEMHDDCKQLDCKQLIKIENFVAKHMAMGMSDLQAAIDDVRSPAQPPAEAGTAGKRTRVDFNDAAKVLFESTLAGWRESSASERHEIARQLLAKAKETAAIDTSIWSITTVREAMNNLLKRTNKKARTAQAATA